MTIYNPEQYLETAIRCLKEYATDGFSNSVENGGNPVGLQIYNVVMEFPGAGVDSGRMPLDKTTIHFELDGEEDSSIGMGDNVFSRVYDPAAKTVVEKEAAQHIMNFDVGVWSSDRSGGTTARMRARQILRYLFVGPVATVNLKSMGDGGDGGLEIVEFTGGRFLTERINDSDVYRMVDCSLVLRVFSRTPDAPPAPAIESITQQPGLTIL